VQERQWIWAALAAAEYVTDEGLAAIKDWKKLKRLNLHGTKVSDTRWGTSQASQLKSRQCGVCDDCPCRYRTAVSLPNLRLTMGGNELGDIKGCRRSGRFPGSLIWISAGGGGHFNIWAINLSDVGLDAVSRKELRELRWLHLEGHRSRGPICRCQHGGRLGRWLEKLRRFETGKLKLQGCSRVGDGRSAR
jgi:hypothetical protein